MNYSKIKIVIVAILFIITSLGICSADEKNKNILFISSYSPNYITFNDQLTGIKKSLGENFFVRAEYMDFESCETNIDEEDSFCKLIKNASDNYGGFDAVILADDISLDFGISNRDDLFKNIPLIFIGVSDLTNIERAKKIDNFYGIVELPSIDDNLGLISKLHSGKNVIAISDGLPEENTEIKKFYELSSKYKNLNFKHLSSKEMSFEEMKNELNKLDDDDVVLLTSLYRDKSGNAMGIEESSKFIADNTNIPTYCVFDYSVEYGFVGGKVISHFEFGKRAGEMVKDILSGKEPTQKIVDKDEVNKYLFNATELKENSIPLYKLPKGYEVIDDNSALMNKYNNMIIIYIIISTCFILVIIVFIVYIIKKKQCEKVLLEAKELAENANKTKDHFISNISHELRTPVAVIMSSNQLLDLNLNKVENEYSSSNNNNIKIIRANCYRLLRLTNNIIDIAKVDSGFMNLRLSNVNIIFEIEEIVESVLPFAKSRNLDIIFDTNEEELIMSVDIEKIEKIVLNLISNAIKFSHEYNNINVSLEKKDNIFILKVKDYGVGIDEKYLNSIFNKFTQVDDTMARKNEGSGIGLSIVKSFVELHDGNIKLNSKLNEGSEFIVELPIRVLDEKISTNYNTSWINEKAKVELSDIY